MNKILAHYRGLLTGCKVIYEEEDRAYVKVVDEKRPKWVTLTDGKRKLFDNTDDAIDWIESFN